MPQPGPTLKDNLTLEEAVDLARHCWFPELPKIKARIGVPEDTSLPQAYAWYQDGVVINPKFFETASSEELKDTIKHELVHAWVAHHYPDEFDEETNGHGERFMKKAIELGLDVRSTLWTYPKSKLIYERLTKRNTDIIAPTSYTLVKPNFSDVRKFTSGLVAANFLPFFWVLLVYSLFLFHGQMNQFTFWGILVVMLISIVSDLRTFRGTF